MKITLQQKSLKALWPYIYIYIVYCVLNNKKINIKNKKVFKNEFKSNKAITLIELIITVIIMLILVGVAISAVIDSEGLFSKTKVGAELYNNAVKDENATLSNLMNYIDRYLMGGITTPGGGDDEEPREPADLTIGIVNTEKNQTFDKQETGTYSNPIIPKGFAPINENGAIWGSEDGYQKGLVITDEIINGVSTGNEFVWVPVDGTNVKFEKIESSGTFTLTKSECTDSVPAELSQSVSDNQGFYIARFEAGIADGMSAPSSDTTTTYGGGTYEPVSKQGATPWNYIKWGTSNNVDTPGNGAVTVARNMYASDDSNYGVVSTLIYGTQWDTALSFIMAYGGSTDYPNFLTNSTGYGNYTSGDNISGTPAVCGATASDTYLQADEFSQKNIYDMAGNVYELTMEAFSSRRVNRGGGYDSAGSDHPASGRAHSDTSDAFLSLGFRIGLYIKGQTES